MIFKKFISVFSTIILRVFRKENIFETSHQQGTIRMAPLKDGGVVNSKGEVYGVKNLVVADNSIMPTP